METLPGRLWEGLRRLESVPGVTIYKQQRTTHDDLIVIPIDVNLGPDHPEGDVPSRTRWFLHVSPDYPLGPVRFYPAKDGGLTKTWPHQSRNDIPTDSNIPWRTGKPCLEVYGQALDHHQGTEERLDDDRLAWRAGRLIHWLRDANDGRLMENGTLLEFPDYRRDALRRLAYVGFLCRRAAPPWSQPGTMGKAILLHVSASGKSSIEGLPPGYYLHRFSHAHLDTKKISPWKERLVESATQIYAAWVATDSVPHEEPWHPIDSFTALDTFLRRNDASLQGLLEQLPVAAWRRDEVFLLVAAQTPRRRGEPSERISWHGLRIGFKDHDITLPHNLSLAPKLVARIILRSNKPVHWMQSHDYALTQHLARGQVAEYLQGARIAILGCGALGSHVAEYMVRGGASKIVLVDDDELEPGNPVRHTLTQADVGRYKVEGLAKRLEAIHPLVQVESINAKIPCLTDEQWKSLEASTVVLNLTADPHVDEYLATRTWPTTAVLVHAAMTLHAQHILVDIQRGPTWDADSIRDLYNNHEAILVKGKDAVLQTPGDIGCRNPLFPAKAYDVAARAADLVRLLDHDDVKSGRCCIPAEE